MRSLKKNQQKMYYAQYLSNQPEYERDENGDIIYIDDGKGNKIPVLTGGTVTGYSEPVEFWANISTCKGEGSAEVFGVSLDYSRSISTSDTSLPINESSRIWLESEVGYKDDGTVDGDTADYSVVQVAKSLNSILYAVESIAKSQN